MNVFYEKLKKFLEKWTKPEDIEAMNEFMTDLDRLFTIEK